MPQRGLWWKFLVGPWARGCGGGVPSTALGGVDCVRRSPHFAQDDSFVVEELIGDERLRSTGIDEKR
jgi:hypothetical protein